ncbi:hypothetical protein KFE25_013281 [Diacronema lutheri]|uniref:NYN domain-containing protein n=1 Tax=Diacronema lutheri TaxID=2081491 RepID=A0A8J5XII8_DIALT|nr:hypothetical protein KFE25_013281 [Diacronema lutheri]
MIFMTSTESRSRADGRRVQHGGAAAAPPARGAHEREASICWDFENLKPSHGAIGGVAAALCAAAARAAPGCALTSFAAFVDSEHQSDAQLVALTERGVDCSDAQLVALTERGVDCVHPVANARKRSEASVKALSLALLLWLWERGERAAAVLLVSADHEFVPLLAKPADAQRVRVVLVAPRGGPRAFRPALASAVHIDDRHAIVARAPGAGGARAGGAVSSTGAPAAAADSGGDAAAAHDAPAASAHGAGAGHARAEPPRRSRGARRGAQRFRARGIPAVAPPPPPPPPELSRCRPPAATPRRRSWCERARSWRRRVRVARPDGGGAAADMPSGPSA